MMNIAVFGGLKDRRSRRQPMINATLLMAYKADCEDKWFFYQKLFAPDAHYKCKADRMSLLVTAANN